MCMEFDIDIILYHAFSSPYSNAKSYRFAQAIQHLLRKAPFELTCHCAKVLALPFVKLPAAD